MNAESRKCGVTLIELLVAIALLGVVVTIVTSVYLPANRQLWSRAKEADRLDSLFLQRNEWRSACRDALAGTRLRDWGGRWDSCLLSRSRGGASADSTRGRGVR